MNYLFGREEIFQSLHITRCSLFFIFGSSRYYNTPLPTKTIMADNHYETLGLTKDAEKDQIKKAYRELAKSLHPDKCQFGESLMKKVNAAYEVLSDDDKRKEYDNSLNRSTRSTPRHQQQSRPRQSGEDEEEEESSSEEEESSNNWSSGGFGGGQQYWPPPPGGNSYYSNNWSSSGGFGGGQQSRQHYSNNWSSNGGFRGGQYSPPPGGSYHSSSSYNYGYSQGGFGFGGSGNYYSYNNKENTSKKKDNHERFLCIICKEIVTKDFWETSCCKKLCCADCLGIDVAPPYAKDRSVCPNPLCLKPMNVRGGILIDGWSRASKFILKQLEEIAPTHKCGRNVLPQNLASHLFVCPELNTQCFKCLGRGKVAGIFGSQQDCSACGGSKYLLGEDWTKCLSCSGTGLNSKINNAFGSAATFGSCTECYGKCAIKGKWMLCPRCTGKGHVTEHVEFETTTKYDGNTKIVFQSITAMPQYAHLSVEELRLQDYLSGNRGTKNVPFSSQTTKKFEKKVNCATCDGKGRLEGKWTVCFLCEGSGSTGSRLKCNACVGKGVIKGFNLRPCCECFGSGCGACSGKGSEKCDCGTKCKGHESVL